MQLFKVLAAGACASAHVLLGLYKGNGNENGNNYMKIGYILGLWSP